MGHDLVTGMGSGVSSGLEVTAIGEGEGLHHQVRVLALQPAIAPYWRRSR